MTIDGGTLINLIVGMYVFIVLLPCLIKYFIEALYL
jgi:hypothetical protein